MFSKISFTLLTICLCGLVQSTPISDFATNVDASVANLFGLNCMADSVLDLEDAADEFSYKITKGCNAADKLATEIADVNALMKLTTKVININYDDNICNNSGFDEDTDSDIAPTSDCAKRIKEQMANLLISFKTTKKDINKGLTQPYSSAACVKIAMSNFKYILNSFPSRIETCAQLAAEV